MIKLGVETPSMNMAIDEAILRARITGAVPNTLRFFRWRPSAVSIGRFRDVFKEVNVGDCMKNGVEIVRRISGGGAIYHDYDGEITYSVIVDGNDLGYRDLDVESAYRKICQGLVEGVRILGTTADFNPQDPKQCPNLTIKGRKISGSAQSIRRGVLLQHGTFLVDINLEKMFTFLRVPWAATLPEVLKISKKKLTSANQELQLDLSVDDVYGALVDGFTKALGVQLVEEGLTNYELKLAEILCEYKFSTEDWNFRGKSAIDLMSDHLFF